MGHPISFNWYPFAPDMGPAPVMPNSPSRMEVERKRVKELVPYAVVFPYKKMGRSISGIRGLPRGRKVRPVRQPDFPRRLHAEHRDARDDGAGERRVAGRVLSLPRRTRHRPARGAFPAGWQAHHRRHESRLARARHEGQPAPAPRLDRAHAVRDSRHPRAARRLRRCASRAPPMPRKPRVRRATRWRLTRTSTSKATAARKWTKRTRPSPPPKSRPTR